MKHLPLGSGHPYALDLEQRVPVVPVQGGELRLGVRAKPSTKTVAVEIEELAVFGGVGSTKRLNMTHVVGQSEGASTDGGHLASAQSKMSRDKDGWLITLSEPPNGSWRYRFVSEDEGDTDWFYTRTATWVGIENVINDEGSSGLNLPEVVENVQVLTDGENIHRLRFTMPLEQGERVVGFGERFNSIDQRGNKLDSRVFEQYKSQGVGTKTYLPMPFAHVIGGAGWGFYVETSERVWFDVGASSVEVMAIEAEWDGLSSLTVHRWDGTPAQNLHKLLERAGRPEELPAWVFRLWASGNEWNTQAEVMRQMALHKEHDIPVGNVVIEAWSDEETFTTFRDARYKVRLDGAPAKLEDFEFPAEGAWPDPKGMVEELHNEGVRVHLWQIPLQKMRPHPKGQALADAQAALRENILIRQTKGHEGQLVPYRNRGWWFPLGLMPDLTDARAAKWWTSRRRYLVEEIGIDGFKTDGGEHAWGSDLVYLNGQPGNKMNNIYPVAYAKAYGDLLRSCGKAPVTFSRAGYVGSQANGAFWAGDENSTWEAFEWSMNAAINAAACGILYWGWDIAGFSGPLPEPELYVRAMAASCFLPIMQYHSEYNHHRKPNRDRTPWNMASTFSDEALISEVREIVKLREALIPYLEEQTRKSIEADLPLLRPLFFEWSDAEEIWQKPLQWMLGEDFLVAPIVQPGDEHSVWLPPGKWVHAWNGEELDGDCIYKGRWPRHQVPLFIRAQKAPVWRTVFR